MSDRWASRWSSRCLLPGCGKPSSWKDEGWGVCPGQQLQEWRQPHAEALGKTTWPRSHGDRWTRRITACICKQKGNVSSSSMDCDDNDTTHRMRAFQQILPHQEAVMWRCTPGQRAILTGTQVFQNITRGLPWWLSGKESACQYRRHGFNPLSGKTPHAVGQLSLCATTRVYALELRSHNYWAQVP